MFCSTECWDCEDKTCEHYVSKQELYFRCKKQEKEIKRLKSALSSIYDDLLAMYSLEDFRMEKILKKINEEIEEEKE